ncbi:hypothetical protein M0R45_023096 [Rubus argutus]|uniref:Endonuclease/exonuclease/phosphatase domain-containing protein n=1 Tax=Rubus argutus TaxID=59490 RepID=A0AAW1WM22_RUBAR
MKYSFRLPPGNYRYTLKIFYGGELKEGENFYRYYVGGEVTWVDELDSNMANLTELNNIASELGYQTTEINYLYRSPTSGNLVKITADQHVTNMIEELPISRELELYIDGVREEEEPEEYPIILFWNCRGLNDAVKLMLRVLVSVHGPTIIFLIETRLSSAVIKELSSSLGFRNIRDSPTSRNVDDIDNCVGLAMLWKTKAKLHFLDKTSNYLDFIVNAGPNNEKWRLTGFYGHPKLKERSLEWLQNLSKNIDLPWLCFGDFNEILDHEEKRGGRKKANLKILAFKNVIKGCDLHDLPFKGRRFTWANNGIKERLDRGLVSSTWKDIFPSPGVFHCTDKTISDHLPIVIKTDGRKQKLRNIETLYAPMRRWRMCFHLLISWKMCIMIRNVSL